MKRWIIAFTTFVAACSGAKTEPMASSGLAPSTGRVVTTFTGEVDLERGTVSVHATPVSSSDPGVRVAMTLPEPGAVTIQNVPNSYWYNDTTHYHGCGSAVGPTYQATWGAYVTVTNQYLGSYVTGVYARITDFSALGYEACRVDPAPSGITSDKGVWRYDVVPTTSEGNQWSFNYAGSANFKFYGEVVGAKATNYRTLVSTGPDTYTPISGRARSNGTNGNVVFPTWTGDGTIQGLGFTSANGSTTRVTGFAGFPTAVAPDPDNGRIWWVGMYGSLGFTNSAGTSIQTGSWSWGYDDLGLDIALDPSDPDAAWVLTSSYGNGGDKGAIRRLSINPATGTIDVSTPTVFTGVLGGLSSYGANAWVTNTTTSELYKVAADGTYATYSTSTPLTCASPGRIMSFGSDLMFTTPTSICKASAAAGSVSFVIAAGTTPRSICVGPGGVAWYTIAGGTTATTGLVRIVSGEATPWILSPSVTYQTATDISCTNGPSGFWAFGGAGQDQMMKVEP